MKTALLITESSVYTNQKRELIVRGGGEMGMHILGKQLIKLGVKPMVFAIREYVDQKEVEVIEGVYYKRFNVRSRTSLNLLRYLRAALRMSREVDFVFLNQFVPHLLLPFLKCIRKIAIVHDVYGSFGFWIKQFGFFKGFFGYFVEKLQLRNDRKYADRIMAVSDYGKMQIAKFLGNEVLNKTVVNSWPLESPKVFVAAIKKNNYALFVGRFVDYKNPEHALLALKKIRFVYSDFKLKMVISRIDEQVLGKFEKLRANLGFAESDIELIFDCSHRELYGLYAEAKILLHPSSVEGLGIVCLEALAHKTPVVAYDLPAYRGILLHRKNAILAPLSDIENFSKGALEVLN
ncbi:glycosyltransferase family 4 protein, partial [Candidatus Peregrinibacteria bacterium]|nr:glycosyltransferase family 4 protein [Candidatus Peregrinibacteria bacterium]